MYPKYEELAPTDLGHLVEENIYAFLAGLARAAGAEIEGTPQLTRYADAEIISPMFNGVIRANIPPEQVEATLAATDAFFAARRRPMAFWWVGPSTRPADLGERLLARGLAPYGVGAPGMAADLHALPQAAETPPGFSVEVVRDAEGAQAWAETFNAIYETPAFAGQAWADAATRIGFAQAPFQLYLGRLDGRPVATNMLACGAGAAGVLGVGTLREARGKGIGAAITLRPYHDARDMGYHTGVLFATDEGTRLYRRLGFREAGAISRYMWRGGE